MLRELPVVVVDEVLDDGLAGEADADEGDAEDAGDQEEHRQGGQSGTFGPGAHDDEGRAVCKGNPNKGRWCSPNHILRCQLTSILEKITHQNTLDFCPGEFHDFFVSLISIKKIFFLLLSGAWRFY